MVFDIKQAYLSEGEQKKVVNWYSSIYKVSGCKPLHANSLSEKITTELIINLTGRTWQQAGHYDMSWHNQPEDGLCCVISICFIMEYFMWKDFVIIISLKQCIMSLSDFYYIIAEAEKRLMKLHFHFALKLAIIIS